MKKQNKKRPKQADPIVVLTDLREWLRRWPVQRLPDGSEFDERGNRRGIRPDDVEGLQRAVAHSRAVIADVERGIELLKQVAVMCDDLGQEAADVRAMARLVRGAVDVIGFPNQAGLAMKASERSGAVRDRLDSLEQVLVRRKERGTKSHARQITEAGDNSKAVLAALKRGGKQAAMIKELQIAESTFYAHKRQLIEDGRYKP